MYLNKRRQKKFEKKFRDSDGECKMGRAEKRYYESLMNYYQLFIYSERFV